MCNCGPGRCPIAFVILASAVTLLSSAAALSWRWGVYYSVVDTFFEDDQYKVRIESGGETGLSYITWHKHQNIEYPGIDCDELYSDESDDEFSVNLENDDDIIDKCVREGERKWKLKSYFADDRLKDFNDDAAKNMMPRSRAAAAFDSLMIIFSILGIIYGLYACACSKRRKRVERFLAVCYLVLSICASFTTWVYINNINVQYLSNTGMGIDDDGEEAVWTTVDDQVVRYLDDYNDRKEVAENLGAIPGCSEGCMVSYVAAFIQLICAIVWLVFAGTCNSDMFEDIAEPKEEEAKPDAFTDILAVVP